MKKLLCFFAIIVIVMNCPFVLAQNSYEPGLKGVAYNGSDLYVAVGFRGAIFMSREGVKWSKVESNTNQTINDVVWGIDQFVAVGDEGIILTSSDGTNWFQVDSTTHSSLQSIASNGEQFVAVGNSGTVLVSSNGAEWKRTRMATMESLMSVKWLNDRYIAVGGGILILTSTDGITWDEVLFEPSFTLSFMDISWNGSTYVVVGDHLSVLISEDGKVWTERNSNKVSNDTEVDFSKCLCSVVWGKDRFLAVGQTGSIISSQDSLVWSGERMVTRDGLRDIVWTGDKYIAVGDEGAILLSYDGSIWEDLREITMDLEEYSMTIGQERQLKVTLKYPYGSEVDITKQATYEVDNKDVAFIDENGVLKTLGIGQTTSKIQYDKKSTDVSVKVSEIMAIDEEKEDNSVNEPDTAQDLDAGATVLKVVIVLIIILVLVWAIMFYRKKINRYME